MFGFYSISLVILTVLSPFVHDQVATCPSGGITIQTAGIKPANAAAPAFKRRIPLPLSCHLT